MEKTLPYSERLSEQWLLERTYHAQLCNMNELSVSTFTDGMMQIGSGYIPVSTWQEVSKKEAQAAYQQRIPILLYSEHTWKHEKGVSDEWRPDKNMDSMIGYERKQHIASSLTDAAICCLDLQRGNSANAAWRTWFSSSDETLFEETFSSDITFLLPNTVLTYTTHYTVIAPDGNSHEYADRREAIQAFSTLPAEKASDGKAIFPQLCYYHDILCLDGVYRLEFFGPRVNEPAYRMK